MKVIIVEANSAAVDPLNRELVDWARALGVDTRVATPTFVITSNADGGCSAHFSMKYQRDGHDYIEPGTNRVATDYGSFVVDVRPGSWPRWFGDPSDVPDVPVPALLEILAAAYGARTELGWRARRAVEAKA